ncbi:MAG: hypothetical protein ACTTH5_05765 [Wolinella sp.]
MELAQLHAFFEETYAFLHQYDEERFEREHIIALFMGIKERVDWLEEAFAPNGAKLSADMSGRFLFVYQNGSMLFKYALLQILEQDRAGGALGQRGFLNVSLAKERVCHAKEFERIAKEISRLGIDPKSLIG